MKKLLLILFVICMSVMACMGESVNPNTGWPHLNPFAYDLKSEVINHGRTVALTYSLNANAVPADANDKTYEQLNNTGRGVQICILDDETVVHTIPIPSNQINKGTHTVELSYNDIPEAYRGKPLQWKVIVWGNNGRTEQKQILDYTAIHTASQFYPMNVHGIAIEKNPAHPHFGKIYITEACSTATTDRNSVLEYDMQLQYKARHHKDFLDGSTSYFSTTVDYEPHRVKISQDGRMFVSCYHTSPNAAVLEYMGDGKYRKIISCDESWYKYSNATKTPHATGNGASTDRFNQRAIDIDVRGSGDDLKIIVAWIIPKHSKLSGTNYWQAKIEIREYAIGNNNTNIDPSTGTIVAEFYDRYSGSSNYGWLYQAFNGAGSDISTFTGLWNMAKHGFVGITYDPDGDIWMRIDYGIGVTWLGEIYLFKKGGKLTYDYGYWQAQHDGNAYYGANGIYVIKEKGKTNYTLITGYNTNLFHKFTIDKNEKEILVLQGEYSQSGENSNRIVGIDEDYAGNLYILNSRGDHTNTDNVVVFAMPYDGKRETLSKSTFTIGNPVPNILATDLKCTPHEKQAKYIFSFNVNTKPEGAEIRFYNTEAAMLADTKDNEAYIKYDNHDNCAYYYRFPTGACKQGTMSVELGILGHPANEKSLSTDMKLPAGKLYWNVYLKTRKSNAFAPIYLQPNTGEDLHYRLHATIDNNPDNDGFGHIYAIDYKREHTDVNAIDNPCALMVYSIGDANVDDNVANQLSSSTRYALVQKLSANDMAQPRRPAVAPDGMVYLTDYGDYRYAGVNFNSTGKGPCEFKLGGIWVFNPNDPHKDADKTAAKLSRFYEEDETVSDACFYDNGSILKLYKTNTYEEFNHHGEGKVDSTYGAVRWMNNGFRIYTIEYNQDGTINHQTTYAAAQVIPFKVKKENGGWVGGDANGSMSVRATSDGVWFCQNRKGDASATIKPDNLQNVVLMFYNNSGERKFQSYTYDGGNLTQYTTSVLQSTPGAGMTISPDEKYLYVVNHEGNILEFEIGGSPSTGKTLTLKNKFINSTDYKCISTMNFDYAGNLVVTTDQSYPAYLDEKTQIVVFTMPYNRDNARSIPASKAQREIPERLSYAEDKENTLATIDKTPTLVDLFRPMPNTSYSTICLPFALDISTLEDGHPYKTADIRAFEGAELSNAVGGEKILYLNFSANPVTLLSANTPYIIQPSVRIPNLVQLPATHWNNDAAPSGPYAFGDNNSITFTGVIPKQDIEVQEGKTLLLVAENRLAEMVPDKTVGGQPVGEILGFRGYFTLGAPLPKGMQAILRNKDNTVTGLVDINGKKVNINKYLREGRVYIRVGDSLYTVDGQKIGR